MHDRVPLLKPQRTEDPVARSVYRRSFFTLVACYAAFEAILLGYFLTAAPSGLWTGETVYRAGGRVIGFAIGLASLAGFAWVGRQIYDRKALLNIVSAMILVVGVPLLASRLWLQKEGATYPEYANLAAWGLLDVLVLHILASVMLPWSPRESLQPFAFLLGVWAICVLVPDENSVLLDRVVGVIVSPIVLAPGFLVASWRAKRRAEDMERLALDKQVRSLGGELSRARIVHDAMFPPLVYNDGHVRFEFAYEPIQEIGGDYVNLHVSPANGCVYVTLLDVAGHGLAAALTVNRLFGELERIRAEDPDATPAEVMRLLNRYINLTMARHSLYATGTCVMLDPSTGELRWVNAGHPPAMLRRINGCVDEMQGTTMLLGALSDRDFRPNEQSTHIEPGDVVIAYTDGAYEARDHTGRPFGLDAVRETVNFRPAPMEWTRFLSNAVTKHHRGMAQDDVLIVTLKLLSVRFEPPRDDEIERCLLAAAESPA